MLAVSSEQGPHTMLGAEDGGSIAAALLLALRERLLDLRE